MGTWAWLPRRLAQLVLVALGVTVIVSFLIHLVPGDPARTVLGLQANPEAVAELHRDWGLDEPVTEQVWRYLGRTVQGDLGSSLLYREPVTEVIIQRIGPTVWLIVMSSLLSVLIATPLAIVAALRKDRAVDHAIRAIPLVGLGMPPAWVGLMLILLFALRLQVLPVGGYGEGFFGHLRSMLLPSLTMALILVPVLIRSLRASLLEVLDADFVTTARSKGLPEAHVIGRHALRLAVLSTITVLGVNVGILVGSTVVVERVFAVPGLGNLLVDAVLGRDFPVVQGVTLVLAVVVVGVYLLTDVVLAALDPRVRAG